MTTEASKQEVEKILKEMIERIPLFKKDFPYIIGLHNAYSSTENILEHGKVYNLNNTEGIPEYQLFILHLHEIETLEELKKSGFVKLHPKFYPEDEANILIFKESDIYMYEIAPLIGIVNDKETPFENIVIIQFDREKAIEKLGSYKQPKEPILARFNQLYLGEEGGIYNGDNLVGKVKKGTGRFKFLQALMDLQDNKDMQVLKENILHKMGTEKSLIDIFTKLNNENMQDSEHKITSESNGNTFRLIKSPK